MAQRNEISKKLDKMKEFDETEECDNDQEFDNNKLDETQKALIKLAKKELDRITFDESDKPVNPDQISALVQIINQYEKLIIPKGFGEEEFFQRFKEKNHLGEQNLEKSNLEKNQEQRQERKQVIEPQKSKNDKIEKREHHFQRRFIVAATSAIILFSFIVLSGVALVDANTSLFKMVRENKDLLYYKNNLALDFAEIPEEDFDKHEGKEVTLEEFLDVYEDDLYLPLELLKDSNFEFAYYYTEALKDFYIYSINIKTNKFLTIHILKAKNNSQQLYYEFSENKSLLDVDCDWENGKVYYDKSKKSLLSVLIFEENLYDIQSNIELDTFLEIIRNLEVYK